MRWLLGYGLFAGWRDEKPRHGLYHHAISGKYFSQLPTFEKYRNACRKDLGIRLQGIMGRCDWSDILGHEKMCNRADIPEV